MATERMLKIIQKMASENAQGARVSRDCLHRAQQCYPSDVPIYRYNTIREQISSAGLYRMCREEMGIEDYEQ